MATLLVCASRTPYPPEDGARIRMFRTLEALSEAHEITLLIVDREPLSTQQRDALEQLCREVVFFSPSTVRYGVNALQSLFSRQPLQTALYHHTGPRQWIDAHADEFDLYYANHVRTTEYLRHLDGPLVVDFVDSIARNYAGHSGIPTSLWTLFYRIEAPRLTRYERRTLQTFDAGFVTSPADRDYIVQGLPEAVSDRLTVLPNGVDRKYLSLDGTDSVSDGQSIVFVGKMDYHPNVDAVTYFCEDVLPAIRAEVPEVTFTVVGSNPTSTVRQLGDREGVTVTGFVDDPAEYVAEAAVVVAPIRHGGGIQNKVLQGMAAGKPVVTTSVGAEGIRGADDGTHIAVEDSPAAFADRVVELLDDPERRVELGNAGRQLIDRRYTWDTVGEELRSVIDRLLRADV